MRNIKVHNIGLFFFILVGLTLLQSVLGWAPTSNAAFSDVQFSGKLALGVMESDADSSSDLSLEEQKYLELSLGVLYSLAPSTAVEASLFGRSTDDDEYWGAQISLPVRLIISGTWLSSYLSPGYRYMNKGLSAPILEGGVNLNFVQDIGLGYRFIFNEWVGNGLETEAQFLISLNF